MAGSPSIQGGVVSGERARFGWHWPLDGRCIVQVPVDRAVRVLAVGRRRHMKHAVVMALVIGVVPTVVSPGAIGVR